MVVFSGQPKGLAGLKMVTLQVTLTGAATIYTVGFK